MLYVHVLCWIYPSAYTYPQHTDEHHRTNGETARTPTGARRFMTWWRWCGVRHVATHSLAVVRRSQSPIWTRSRCSLITCTILLRRNILIICAMSPLADENGSRCCQPAFVCTFNHANLMRTTMQLFHFIQRSTPTIHCKCMFSSPFPSR